MLKKPCIYLITCNKTFERYVGSAHYLHRRFNEHKYWFKRGEHANHKMQAIWDKYGEDVFDLTVLEYVSSLEVMNEREQHWIDTLKPELNIVLFVEQPSRGVKRSAATVERMRQTRLAYHANLTPEQKTERREKVKQGWHEWWDSLTDEERLEARKRRSHGQTDAVRKILSEKSKANNPRNMLGKTHSLETRAKLSAAAKGRKPPPITEEERQRRRDFMTGRKLSPETIQKLVDSHKGKKLTEEHKQKLREAHKGRPGRPISDETKEKLRQVALAQQADPEYRRKHAEGLKAAMTTPEMREKLSKAHKGTKLSAEHAANIGKATRGKKRSEATKLKMREAQLARWAKRKQNQPK